MLQAQISVSMIAGGEYASRRREGGNKKTTDDIDKLLWKCVLLHKQV
ncbi:MAG: hypothetical protein LBB29_01985 [Holosporaceae bacterium]|jgi:hypothetical protein|nr:hypothetical protein [Holosporaceae bacterium]